MRVNLFLLMKKATHLITTQPFHLVLSHTEMLIPLPYVI